MGGPEFGQHEEEFERQLMIDEIKKLQAESERLRGILDHVKEERKKMDDCALRSDYCCLTGDCNHATYEECFGAIREYVAELCDAGDKLEAENQRLREELQMEINRAAALKNVFFEVGREKTG